MAQIFRVYKFEVPTLIHVFYRNYNQRLESENNIFHVYTCIS